jgi:hypothetical protein
MGPLADKHHEVIIYLLFTIYIKTKTTQKRNKKQSPRYNCNIVKVALNTINHLNKNKNNTRKEKITNMFVVRNK